MTQATPTEHSSLVGGSTAARRMNCPGSYKREQIAPKSKGSPYAREGTALHEMIAQVLDKDLIPEDMLPFTHNQPAKGVEEAWSLTIDEDLWDRLGRPALEMFDRFLEALEAEQGTAAVYMVEESADFPGVPGAKGTSDVPFRCGEVGGIWDWKFGRGEVKAEDNAQLLFYYRACSAKHEKFFEGVKRVQLCISQPQVNDREPDVWETDPGDVEDFSLELVDAIKLAQTDDAPIERGSWCKFADCKAVCELHIGAAAALGAKMAALKGAREPEKVDAGTPQIEDMGAFLSDAMELAEMAEDWAKHVAGITQERVEAGLPVPGWKIVPKRSAGRDWIDTIKVSSLEARLRRRGLTVDDFREPPKLKSPAKVDDILKKKGLELLTEKECLKKPSSGYTLTREGDPRHAAVPPAEKAQTLGAALMRAIGKNENHEH